MCAIRRTDKHVNLKKKDQKKECLRFTLYLRQSNEKKLIIKKIVVFLYIKQQIPDTSTTFLSLMHGLNVIFFFLHEKRYLFRQKMKKIFH